MNVIIDYGNEWRDLDFIANINWFTVGCGDEMITFLNGNKYYPAISREDIAKMMSKYIPFLDEKETKYKYIERNIKHWNIIKEKVFNALMVAYKNNEDIYIIQEIKNIMKEYFETQGQ